MDNDVHSCHAHGASPHWVWFGLVLMLGYVKQASRKWRGAPRVCSPLQLAAQRRNVFYTSSTGIAAVLELLAEPFYILASVHLMFKWVLGSRAYAMRFGAGVKGTVWGTL